MMIVIDTVVVDQLVHSKIMVNDGLLVMLTELVHNLRQPSNIEWFMTINR